MMDASMSVKVLQAPKLRTKSLTQNAACACTITNASTRWSRAADAVTVAGLRKEALCPDHWSCLTIPLAVLAARKCSCTSNFSKHSNWLANS